MSQKISQLFLFLHGILNSDLCGGILGGCLIWVLNFVIVFLHIGFCPHWTREYDGQLRCGVALQQGAH
jgi:hypothetical protein